VLALFKAAASGNHTGKLKLDAALWRPSCSKIWMSGLNCLGRHGIWLILDSMSKKNSCWVAFNSWKIKIPKFYCQKSR